MKRLGWKSPLEVAFKDVSKIPGWAKEAVGMCVAKGIIYGYPDNTFRGEKPVTRAEAAAMILQLLEVLGEK